MSNRDRIDTLSADLARALARIEQLEKRDLSRKRSFNKLAASIRVMIDKQRNTVADLQAIIASQLQIELERLEKQTDPLRPSAIPDMPNVQPPTVPDTTSGCVDATADRRYRAVMAWGNRRLGIK